MKQHQDCESRVGHDAAARYTLNLGCGRKYLPDALNVDLHASTNPDIVHNLNSIPWPLPDDQFGTVLLGDSLEHLKDIVATMEEIHRVCQNGAVVRITTPHFSSSNSSTDPTHPHHFSYFSFDYFTGDHEFAFHTKSGFGVVARIIFNPTVINKLVWCLANRHPRPMSGAARGCSRHGFLSFEIELVK